MVMRYWLRVDRDIQGPYTIEELSAQGAQDSTLVCPEGLPRDRHENWLPLRKAKEPPRFYVRVDSQVHGPLTGAELDRLGGFCGDTLVCPERRDHRERWNWAAAKTFAALAPGEVAASVAPASRAAVATPKGILLREFVAAAQCFWNNPIVPVAAGMAALILGLLLWLQFSFRPRVQQTYLRVHTSLDLASLAVLQARHHRQTGVYADDLESLIRDSGDPGLPAKMAKDLDMSTLLVRGNASRFVLEANSLDENRTLIRFEVPAPIARMEKTTAVSQHKASAGTP